MSDNVTLLTEPPRKRLGKSPVLKDGDVLRVPIFAMDGTKASARVADTAATDARKVANDAYAAFVDSISIATVRASLSDVAFKAPDAIDRHRAAEAFRMIDHGDLAGGLAGIQAMVGSHRIALALDSSPERRHGHEAAIAFLEGVATTVSGVKVPK